MFLAIARNFRVALRGQCRALSRHEVPAKDIQLKIMKKKTPKGALDERVLKEGEEHVDPALPKHPGGINPITGERGGPAGPEPTRYGDWERKGRCVDF